MKGCNTEERKIVKSMLNAMKKDFPMAFRKERLYKKQRKMIRDFHNEFNDAMNIFFNKILEDLDMTKDGFIKYREEQLKKENENRRKEYIRWNRLENGDTK